MKALKNWIVVLQFVALVQIAYVGSFLRASARTENELHAEIYARIEDPSLRTQIRQRQEGQSHAASRLVIGFGSAMFALSTIAAFCARRVGPPATVATGVPSAT